MSPLKGSGRKIRIGRNQKCYCGSGLKFKKCCWTKHAVLPSGTITPEVEKLVKKQERYFQKHRKVRT